MDFDVRMRIFRDTKLMAALMCLFYCGLVGCSPLGEIGLAHPDEVLFDRAMDAVQQKQFTVAHITLVNTYPDSEYADKARLALRNPRIADCGDGWSTSPDECDGTLKPERPE